MYTNMVLVEDESVLIREMALFQGCPYTGVALYTNTAFVRIKCVLI